MRFTLNWKSFPILIKTFDLMQNAAAVQHKNENNQTMVCVWHVKKRNHSRNFNNSNASFASYVRKKAGNRYLDTMAANRMIYGDNRETHFRRMQTFSTRIIASLARISGKTANFYGSHTHAYTRNLMRIIHSILPTLHFLASLKLRWLCVFGNKFDENGKNLNGRGQTFVA